MGRSDEFSSGRGDFDPGNPPSGMSSGKHPSELRPGDTVISGGRYSEVVDVQFHKPGEHPHSPIRNHLPAWEVVTTNGSRWSGGGPDGYLGYTTYHPAWQDETASPMPLHENKKYLP